MIQFVYRQSSAGDRNVDGAAKIMHDHLRLFVKFKYTITWKFKFGVPKAFNI